MQLVGGGGGEAAALTGAYLAQLAQTSARTLCERITNTRDSHWRQKKRMNPPISALEMKSARYFDSPGAVR